MRTRFLFAILLALNVLASYARPVLRFRPDGTFRVAQFTDLHWDDKSPNCAKTVATIQAVLAQEKPDVAILTGDVVTEQPAMDGWRHVAQIFERAQVPFIVEMGNHDAEVADKDSIYALMEQSPWYAGERGPVNISGAGNCVVPVWGAEVATNEGTRGDGYLPVSSQSKKKAPAALLYCIDSNDYQPVKEYGEYDWIHFDQVAWYRDMSDYYTRLNGGKAIPALAFFHIPLPEMRTIHEQGPRLGLKHEGVANADVNSGMFAAFLEKHDVMGIFNGHDHDNSYAGLLKGIAMCYGRVTGADASATNERGGRIIKLYEGQHRFDTWAVTPRGAEDVLYYPSAITSKDEREMNFLPAKNVKPKKQGVAYEYFEGNFKKVKDMAGAKVAKKGVLPQVTISGAPVEDHFGYVFRAYMSIPEDGVYRFYTYSDDGSQLLIDGQLVVDNDGGHSARRVDGKVALCRGWHEMTIRYFEDYMGQTLQIGYCSKTIPETNEIELMVDK